MPHECTDCGRAFPDGSKEMLSGCPRCGGNTFQFRPEGVDAPDQREEPPEPPDPPGDGVTRTVGNAATAVRDLVDGVRPSGPDRPAGEAGATAGAEEDHAQASARADLMGDLPPSPGGADAADQRRRAAGEWPAESEASESGRGDRPTARPGDGRERQDDDTDATSNDQPQSSRFSTRVNAGDPEAAEQQSTATEPKSPDVDHERGPAPTVDADPEPAPEGAERPDLAELRAELNDQFESIRVLEPGQYELNLMELYDREEYIVALQEDGKYTIQVPDRWSE